MAPLGVSLSTPETSTSASSFDNCKTSYRAATPVVSNQAGRATACVSAQYG